MLDPSLLAHSLDTRINPPRHSLHFTFGAKAASQINAGSLLSHAGITSYYSSNRHIYRDNRGQKEASRADNQVPTYIAHAMAFSEPRLPFFKWLVGSAQDLSADNRKILWARLWTNYSSCLASPAAQSFAGDA